MKLLIIFGPPAVGKMTVGKILEVQTGFKLFHNHAVMDGIMHIFGRGSPSEDRLSRLIREQVIKEAADSNTNLILTYVWNFSREKGKQNIDAYKQLYEARGGKVYFVELVASREARLARATDPERYRIKAYAPTPNEIAQPGEVQKFQSPSTFYYPGSYTQIDTSNKLPTTVASEITEWLESF